ncbi:MAG: hypothetical protein KatS3mg051_1712 [Anaerolineae bacterium]|nr:MAG: hypothetical protein KatS3mg051_1712 [Anaerolineae bacterium]
MEPMTPRTPDPIPMEAPRQVLRTSAVTIDDDTRERIIDTLARLLPLQLLLGARDEREIIALAYDYVTDTVRDREAFIARSNKLIDLPVIPEWIEGVIIGMIYDAVEAAIKQVIG